MTCIDLEIPAREPRYFASGVVGPDVLNGKRKPKSEKKNGKGTGDDRAKIKITRKNDISHSKDAQVGKKNKDGKNEAEMKEKKEEIEDEFNPFKSKKSTSTLHFDTVLFTIYAVGTKCRYYNCQISCAFSRLSKASMFAKGSYSLPCRLLW